MELSQTPEQILLREEATRQNQEFATLEGRALQDVRETISYLAVGRRPETVLGGLMLSQFGLYDSTLVAGNDRGAIEIGVKGLVAPISPNERGDTVTDVLEGLVSLGFAERVYTPNTVEALMLPDDDLRKRLNEPRYRLSTKNLPQTIEDLITKVEERKIEIDESIATREERKARPRRKVFGRRKQ